MPLILLLLTLSGLIAACMALYQLCAHIVPVTMALIVAWIALRTGAGLIGAAICGSVAFAAAVVITRLILSLCGRPAIRTAVTLLLIAPPACIGFSVSLTLLATLVPSPVWRTLFAIAISIALARSAYRGLYPLRPAA